MNKTQSYVLYGITVLAVFFVLLFRLSGDWGREVLYPLDGGVFLSDALFHSFAENAFIMSNAAFCVISRCAAYPVCIGNLGWISRYYRFISVFTAALVIAMPLLPFYARRLPLTVRLLVACLITFLPWNIVSLGNVAGLSCFMFCVIAFMTIADYSCANRFELALLGMVFLLAALSTPYAGLALPVMIWRYARRKDMRTRTVFGGMIFLIIALQGWLLRVLVSQNTAFGMPYFFAGLLSAINTFGYNVVCMTAMGQRWAQVHCKSWLASYAAWILFFLFSILCCRISRVHWRRRRDENNYQLIIIAALYYMLIPLTVQACVQTVRIHDFLLMDLYPGCNCLCFVSACFALVVMSLNVYILVKRYRNIITKCIVIFLLCAYAVVIQRNFFYEEPSDGGWYMSVEQYYQDIADGMNGYDDYRIRLNNAESAIIRLPLPRDIPGFIRERKEVNTHE